MLKYILEVMGLLEVESTLQTKKDHRGYETVDCPKQWTPAVKGCLRCGLMVIDEERFLTAHDLWHERVG